MSLSKSEGVWGNKEAIPHVIKFDRRLLQQPETQPDNAGNRGKTDHFSEASPSRSPSPEVNYLLSLYNSTISYGSGNRMTQYDSVYGSFYHAYPPPPVPSAYAEVSRRNIFSNFGDHDA